MIATERDPSSLDEAERKARFKRSPSDSVPRSVEPGTTRASRRRTSPTHKKSRRRQAEAKVSLLSNLKSVMADRRATRSMLSLLSRISSCPTVTESWVKRSECSGRSDATEFAFGAPGQNNRTLRRGNYCLVHSRRRAGQPHRRSSFGRRAAPRKWAEGVMRGVAGGDGSQFLRTPVAVRHPSTRGITTNEVPEVRVGQRRCGSFQT